MQKVLSDSYSGPQKAANTQFMHAVHQRYILKHRGVTPLRVQEIKKKTLT